MEAGIEQGVAQVALALFTTLVPSGVFAFVVVAVYLLAGKVEDAARERLGHFLSIPLAVTILGLIASTNHLGRPSNTMYVLMGVGRSPLSNEVSSVIVFLGLAWIAWLLSFGSLRWRKVSRVLLALACAASVFVIAAMANAYRIDTIVSWALPYTQVNLVLTAPMGGSALALCTFAAVGVDARGHRRLYGGLVAAGAASTAAACASQCMQYVALGEVRSGLATASSLVPFYPACIAASAIMACIAWVLCARRLRACACASSCAGGPSGNEGEAPAGAGEPSGGEGEAPAGAGGPAGDAEFSVALAAGASALVLAAVFVVRFAFYCMHLTAGL